MILLKLCHIKTMLWIIVDSILISKILFYVMIIYQQLTNYVVDYFSLYNTWYVKYLVIS